MKKNKLTVLLSAMMILAMGTTAFAATGGDNWTVGETTSVDVEVTATVGSDFTVTIPKTVTLTNANNGTGTWTAEFNTTAKGDIGTDQELHVAPSVEEFTLKSNANVNEICTITKGVVAFSRDELLGDGTTATHSLSAELTPGTWEGTFDFDIELVGIPK